MEARLDISQSCLSGLLSLLLTMPPRKSLPAPTAAVHRSTPRRGQSSTPQKVIRPITITRKRQRPAELEDDLESIEADDSAPVTRQTNGVKPKSTPTTGMDPEKELEHWQDFAVEHYEMVEQLPLELHRNYRLLRELDDGVAGKLQSLTTKIRADMYSACGETTDHDTRVHRPPTRRYRQTSGNSRGDFSFPDTAFTFAHVGWRRGSG